MFVFDMSVNSSIRKILFPAFADELTTFLIIPLSPLYFFITLNHRLQNIMYIMGVI